MSAENPAWKSMDETAIHLFRYPQKSLWNLQKDTMAAQLRILPMVHVGLQAAAPLTILQLIYRLPKCMIYADSRRDDFIFVRFNGGQAIIAPTEDFIMSRVKPAFSICRPRYDRLEQIYTFKPDRGFHPTYPTAQPQPRTPASWPPPEYSADDLPTFEHDC